MARDKHNLNTLEKEEKQNRNINMAEKIKEIGTKTPNKAIDNCAANMV